MRLAGLRCLTFTAGRRITLRLGRFKLYSRGMNCKGQKQPDLGQKFYFITRFFTLSLSFAKYIDLFSKALYSPR